MDDSERVIASTLAFTDSVNYALKVTVKYVQLVRSSVIIYDGLRYVRESTNVRSLTFAHDTLVFRIIRGRKPL